MITTLKLINTLQKPVWRFLKLKIELQCFLETKIYFPYYYQVNHANDLIQKKEVKTGQTYLWSTQFGSPYVFLNFARGENQAHSFLFPEFIYSAFNTRLASCVCQPSYSHQGCHNHCIVVPLPNLLTEKQEGEVWPKHCQSPLQGSVGAMDLQRRPEGSEGGDCLEEMI